MDLKREPHVTKWFNGSGWVDYYGVPIGLVQVSVGGTITGIKQFDYNRDYSQWETVASIKPYVGGGLPAKYLLCNGANTYSPLLYNDLYRKIAIAFGGVLGESFAVPDFVNKTIWGSDTMNIFNEIAAGLPNIKGSIGFRAIIINNGTGPLYLQQSQKYQESSGGDVNGGILGFDASLANSIYSDDVSTVQPPALQVPLIIKYTI